MAEDRLTILYELSDIMARARDEVTTKHDEDFQKIIDYVKTSEKKERLMAAQVISRFFKYFPKYEEPAFNSIVDLCKSSEIDVREQSIMAMIAICRDCKHLVSKAADELIQLYQTDRTTEVQLINQSFTTLMNLNITEFLQSFFTNFEDGSEVVRDRALEFLASQAASLTKEVEEQLLTYSKKAMENVTKDEFITFMGILGKLKIAKTASGQAMIALVIKSQAELQKDFDVNSSDDLDKFLLCTQQTIPYLSLYNRSSEYVNYICIKILPHLDKLTANGQDLKILQVLAEMSPHIHEKDIPELLDLEKCQQAVYEKLVEFLPLPKDNTEQIKEIADVDQKTDEAPKNEEVEKDPQQPEAEEQEQSEPQEKESEPKQQSENETEFKFTHIEYLIYTFHQFGRVKPEFFTESLQNDVRIRLQHLALGCSKYLELLSSVKTGQDVKKEDSQIRSVAIRTTKNISLLVKDLFKKPPHFKSDVLLSCKPLAPKPEAATLGSSSTGKPNQSRNFNNNNHSRNQGNRGGQGNGYFKNNSNGGNNNRQPGQKFKYRQNYQEQGKKPRYAR